MAPFCNLFMERPSYNCQYGLHTGSLRFLIYFSVTHLPEVQSTGNLFKETLVMNSQTKFSPQFKRLISDSVNLREIRWRPS